MTVNNSLKEYLKSCKKFSTDTKDWSRMEFDKFYTTGNTINEIWAETCDNAHGGLDLSWCFHKDEDFIESHYLIEFLNQWINDLQQAVDEEFDVEQIIHMIDKYL